MPDISTSGFGTHEKPPETMRLLFRRLQKAAYSSDALANQIFDVETIPDEEQPDLRVHYALDQSLVRSAFLDFLDGSLIHNAREQRVQQPLSESQMLEFKAHPGARDATK